MGTLALPRSSSTLFAFGTQTDISFFRGATKTVSHLGVIRRVQEATGKKRSACASTNPIQGTRSRIVHFDSQVIPLHSKWRLEGLRQTTAPNPNPRFSLYENPKYPPNSGTERLQPPSRAGHAPRPARPRV